MTFFFACNNMTYMVISEKRFAAAPDTIDLTFSGNDAVSDATPSDSPPPKTHGCGALAVFQRRYFLPKLGGIFRFAAMGGV